MRLLCGVVFKLFVVVCWLWRDVWGGGLCCGVVVVLLLYCIMLHYVILCYIV